MSKENMADYVAKEMAKKYNKEQYQRAQTHPKFEKLKAEIGRKQAIETALNDLNNKQK
jgi:hypothetical protein